MLDEKWIVQYLAHPDLLGTDDVAELSPRVGALVCIATFRGCFTSRLWPTSGRSRRGITWPEERLSWPTGRLS